MIKLIPFKRIYEKETLENKMNLENRSHRDLIRQTENTKEKIGLIGSLIGREIQRCVSVQVREYRGPTAIDSMGTRMDHQSPDNLYLPLEY